MDGVLKRKAQNVCESTQRMTEPTCQEWGGKTQKEAELEALLRQWSSGDSELEAVFEKTHILLEVINWIDETRLSSTFVSTACELLLKAASLPAAVSQTLVDNRAIPKLCNLIHRPGIDLSVLRPSLRILALLAFSQDNACMLAENRMVETFVRYTENPDRFIQATCCIGLVNFSAHGQARRMISSGAVRPLLHLLSSDDPQIQDCACNAIVNLQANKFGDIVYANGGLDALLRLNGSTNIDLQRVSQKGLGFITCVPDELVVTEMMEKGAVLAFIRNANSDDVKMVQYASFALFKLISRRETSAQLATYLANHDGISILLKLTRHPDSYVRTNACWALVHVSVTPSCPYLMQNGGIEAFIRIASDPKLLECSSSGIAIMSSRYPQQVEEKGGIDACANLLQSTDWRTVEKVVRGLTSLSTYFECRSRMAFHPTLPALLYSSENPKAKNLIKLLRQQDTAVLSTMTLEHYPKLAVPAAILFPRKSPSHTRVALMNMLRKYDPESSHIGLSLILLSLRHLDTTLPLSKCNDLETLNFPTELTFCENGSKKSHRIFSDLILVPGDGGEPVPCHKHMLLESPFFNSRLQEEPDVARIVLDDIEGATVQKLVDCLYSPKVEINSFEDFFHLSRAADRYQFKTAQKGCSELLRGFVLGPGLEGSEVEKEVAQFLNDFHFEGPGGEHVTQWIVLNWKWWKGAREALLLPHLGKFRDYSTVLGLPELSVDDKNKKNE
eukprot:TRINITY_DN4219_c0_g1_i1.p1 TRINITY_DN4219_c0_g1~~TRINITY_DN4219_c0_g1_i1.p1  ORF type:complete len:730 (-),score=43.58 TRINITY_DN4219_c0_g1_i1:8-2197(-)